jgi:Tol biopolymer transport system component
VPWAIAAALAVIAVVASTRSIATPDAELPTLRYSIGIPGLAVEPLTLPALSPDGQTLAYVKDGGLWVRALSQLEPRQIAGVAAPQHLIWSPDSQQIAYFEGSTLSRVALDGSRPVRIAATRFNRGGRTPGGVWRPDGQIVFAPSATGSGLLSVPAQGGEFRETYRGDPAVEGDLHRPSLLPDGKTLIFVVDHVNGGADTIGLLDGSTRKDLLTIKGEMFDSPVYSPTGHIVFHRESLAPGVWAVPFSLERQEVTGEPFSVAPSGSYPNVSPNGTLVYADRQLSGLMRLVWVDLRTFAITAAIDQQYSELLDPRLSPDGRQALVTVRNREGGGRALVVVDLQRRMVRTLTEDVEQDSFRKTWLTATTVVYGRKGNPGSALVMGATDGSGTPRELAQGMQPTATADGRHLVFSRLHAGTGGDLWHMTLDPRTGTASAEQLFDRLPHHQFEPALSPDGRLLAYTSVTVGNQPEVILRRYPEDGGNWQVSAAGGSNAVWSRAGDALFYRDVAGQLMRVSVTRGPDVTLGTPVPIVLPPSLISRRGFDPAPGDGRMLMVQNVVDPTSPVPSLVVVQNWVGGN